MSVLRTLCVALCLVLTPGCIYTNVTQPLDTDVQATRLGLKEGRSDSYGVLGVVAWGDRGTKAAAEQGGITTIHHMDTQTFAILWFVYWNVTTIVYGE